MTVYWVVWDAAAHWVVDRLDREGALPAVGRLRRLGTFAAARPARPNCQTPPSLATLFTGSWPREHGVTGFTVPGGGSDDPWSHVSGFSPQFPAVRPVWDALADRGLRGAFVHTPWVFGASDTTAPYVDAAVEAYSRRVVRHDVFAVRPGGGRTRPWQLGPYVLQVSDPEPGGPVTVRTADGAGVTLVPGGGWHPLRLAAAEEAPGTWLAYVRGAEGPLVVHTGVWRPRFAGGDDAVVDALRSASAYPFAGEGVGPLYRSGAFGPRLAEGGDGSAEDVFLSSVECVARSFGAAVDAVLAAHTADLVVVYLPMTDDVGHELLGWCDPQSAAHRPDIADTAWERITRCYRWADAVLDRVLDRAGPGDTVLLGADHGMVGSTHLVHLNEQLIRAGLAARGPDGAVEPERSAVYYHPANNGSLWAGPAASAEPGAELERAMRVLEDITDPGTGTRVVARFLDEDGGPLAPEAADGIGPVYVALADDYQPTAASGADGPVVRRTPKPGAHVVNTGSSRLHAVFAAVAPGIAPGSGPPVVDNTLPSRLVARQLGLPVSDLSTKDPVLGTCVASPLTVPLAELVSKRSAHVSGFLADRGLSPQWLSGLMRERVGEGLLLLTSSPVHGLANSTSDLDFIRIQEKPITGPRISTKIFEGGHHLEVVSFSRAELQANLHHLVELAAREPGGTIAGFRRWDKEREPRRKQTERIVNGITLDGEAPFLDWLPALSTVWSRAALHSALEQVVHLSLAEAAGERRGRVGYAFNTLLHLMDALLSDHSDVYTTRKWYLLRWARLVREAGWRDARTQAVASEVERLRKQIGSVLLDAADERPMAPEYLALAEETAGATDTAARITVRCVPVDGARTHAFLPGASMLLAAGGGLVLPGQGEQALPLAHPVALADLAGLDAGAAARLLRSLRAGAYRLEIDYVEEETA
ncbi:DUF6001 family protein [Streptomyces sp. NPDC054766]